MKKPRTRTRRYLEITDLGNGRSTKIPTEGSQWHSTLARIARATLGAADPDNCASVAKSLLGGEQIRTSFFHYCVTTRPPL
jgi:hypothetical protein